MPDDIGDDLTEAQKQLYRKKKVPKKFCPYCGTRNEPEVDRCVSCGKDISWIKVPETLPPEERPFQVPRSLPEQEKPVFTWKAILVFVLVLLAIAALVLVIYFTTRDGKAGASAGIRVTAISAPGPCEYRVARAARSFAQSGNPMTSCPPDQRPW